MGWWLESGAGARGVTISATMNRRSSRQTRCPPRADALRRSLQLVWRSRHASCGRARTQTAVLLAQVQASCLPCSQPQLPTHAKTQVDAAAINEGASQNGCAAKLPSLGFALFHEVNRVQAELYQTAAVTKPETGLTTSRPSAWG